MPLLKLKDIAHRARLGIWEITEPEAFFTEQLPESFLESGFESFQLSPRRKLEYLASRFLLFQILDDRKIALAKDENGKPFLVNSKAKISISHTKDLAAVMVSGNSEVGLDIERVHERIERIMYKFLNEQEQSFFKQPPNHEKLTLCWAAKESIYKWYGKKELSFQKNIPLEDPDKGQKNWFKAIFSNEKIQKELKIYHEKIQDNVLAYVVEEGFT